MKKKQQLDQSLRWGELLPILFIVGVVPLLFKRTEHLYSQSEQILYASSGFYDLYSFVKVQVLVVMTVLALVVFIYHIRSKRIYFEKSVYIIGAGIYAGTIILSSLFSEYDMVYKGFSDRFEGMWVLLSYAVIFVIALHYGRQEKAKILISYVFLGSGFLLCLFGLMQYAGYDPYTEGFLRFFAFPRDIWATIGENMITDFKAGVVSSLYNANYMGSYSAMFSLLSLGFVLKEENKAKRILYLIANLIAIAALVGSRSSAAFLGFFVGLILMILFAPNQFKEKGKTLTVLFTAWVGVVVFMSIIYKNTWDGARMMQQDYYTLLLYAGYFLIMTMIYLQIFTMRKKNKVLAGITVAYGVLALVVALVLYNPIQNTTANVYFGKSIAEVTGEQYVEEKLKDVTITTNQIRITEEDGSKIVFEINDFSPKAFDEEGNDLELGMLESGYYKTAAAGNRDYELVLTTRSDMPEQFIYAMVPEFGIWTVITNQGLKYMGRNHMPIEIDHPAHMGFDGRQSLFSARGYIWSRTLPLIKDNLFIGAGPDAFVFEFPQYEHVERYNLVFPIYQLIDKPHDWYLQMAVNTGLLSMITILAMGILLLWQAVKKFMLENQEDVMTVTIVAMVFAYAVAGIFNDSVVQVAPVFWIFFGLAVGAVNGLNQPKKAKAKIETKKEARKEARKEAHKKMPNKKK